MRAPQAAGIGHLGSGLGWPASLSAPPLPAAPSTAVRSHPANGAWPLSFRPPRKRYGRLAIETAALKISVSHAAAIFRKKLQVCRHKQQASIATQPERSARSRNYRIFAGSRCSRINLQSNFFCFQFIYCVSM
jgi:hypothetical protein